MDLGCPDLSRDLSRLDARSLLKVGTAGIAGLNLPGLLRAAEKRLRRRRTPKAKHVIFLHQFGGPSHIDTFDMKPDAPDGIRGEFKPIASSTPGLNLTEHLPKFSKVLGRFAQIRSVNHRMKNHNSATYYSLTGHAPPHRRHPAPRHPGALPRVRQHRRPVRAGRTTRPCRRSCRIPTYLRDGSVTPGQSASFLGKAFDPFFVGGDPNSSSTSACPN